MKIDGRWFFHCDAMHKCLYTQSEKKIWMNEWSTKKSKMQLTKTLYNRVMAKSNQYALCAYTLCVKQQQQRRDWGGGEKIKKEHMKEESKKIYIYLYEITWNISYKMRSTFFLIYMNFFMRCKKCWN
jgi:hypothetical protein